MLNRLPRLLVLLGFVFGGAGCATNVPAVARKPASVRLVITNRTNHIWRIVVRATDPERAAAQTAQVGAQGVVELTFPRGDYVIEQTLLDAGSAGLATREFPARFETGEYQWELATLLSATEMPAPPTAAVAGTASRE